MTSKIVLLFLAPLLLLDACTQVEVNPTLRDCYLKTMLADDSLRFELEYANNKLIKETSYGQKSGFLYDSSLYNYEPGKVVKKRYNHAGINIWTETYELNAFNNVVLYTCTRKGDEKEYFDTIRYSYDGNNYLIRQEGNLWTIAMNPSETNHSISTQIFTYPDPAHCTINSSFQYSYPTNPNIESGTTSIEYLTDIEPNPNSFQHAPYFLGKTDHLLMKRKDDLNFMYKFDNDKNVIEKKEFRSNQLLMTQTFIYDCP